MLISEAIAKMKATKDEHGDLPLTTWDGNVQDIRICPSYDGCLPHGLLEKPNEISMEIISEY